MVRHWWAERGKEADWKWKISFNGVGFLLTTFILITLSVVKFFEGGWITLVVTGFLVALAVLIKRHYNQTALDLRHLDELAAVVEMDIRV
jgi:K+ transporter